MKIRRWMAGVGALALTLGAGSAGAATIVLQNIGGVTPGSAAYDGFRTAANFWGSLLTNDVTINVEVGFQHLGPNILGQTGSSQGTVYTQDVETLLTLGSSHDSVDTAAVAHLPALTASTSADPSLTGAGAVSPYTRNGATPGAVPFGATPSLDNDGSANNVLMNITTANAKALGYDVPSNIVDGLVEFSSDFKFDFNAEDGVAADSIDFLGVAIHEIGHALGFVSGVDDLDVSDGTFDAQNTPYATPLDLFRYGATGTDSAAALTWAPGVASYFSVDGGATNLCNFSTGQVNGDGWQASHWQRLGGAGGGACGIMDPAVSFGQEDAVSAVDLQAFDAIGYNLAFDPGQTSGFISTGQIQALFGVPEPATWALMLLGFGGLGGALRRRRLGLAI